MKKLISQKIRNFYHLGQAILANLIYGFPSRKIKVIGVTGTNGKTTVCQMIAKILEEAGYKIAMATTINFKILGKEWVNKTKFTTLSSWATQKFIRQAVETGCKCLILETSSHSLDQNRVWGIKYDTAVITNVTREHLDYHKTMEEYRIAKLRLLKNAKIVVVNLDMENPEEFLQFNNEIKYIYTCHPELVLGSGFRIKSGMTLIKAENIELGANNTKYQIQNTKYLLNLLGLFNVENALAATCVGMAEGINPETIEKALEKIRNIPGRMEYVPNSLGLNIIVDFALTPDALGKLYTLIDSIKKDANIISVFGACGERDRGKRPIIGKIVSEHADYVILTDDEPYCEDPKRIIEEISAGIKNKAEEETIWKIPDRREAIRKALFLARSNDFVVVTGMGAEDTRAVGNQKIPWNDKEVILEELKITDRH